MRLISLEARAIYLMDGEMRVSYPTRFEISSAGLGVHGLTWREQRIGPRRWADPDSLDGDWDVDRTAKLGLVGEEAAGTGLVQLATEEDVLQGLAPLLHIHAVRHHVAHLSSRTPPPQQQRGQRRRGLGLWAQGCQVIAVEKCKF